jgi:phage-related baseplate assembly protein
MSQFNAIDLSTLPKPDVIEVLDYEALFNQRKAEFNALQPLLLDESFQPKILPAQLLTEPDGTQYWKVPVDSNAGLFYLGLESEPLARLLQVDIYRELLLRQRVNDAAHSVMIAYAVATDLDNIGARYGVIRLTITPEDLNAVPPVAAVYESDDAFRKRILLSLEGLTTAGSEGSYIFHALSADGLVKSVSAVSPEAAQVTITVLSHEGNGTADNDLLATVTAALNSENVRPITDELTVQSAEILEYELIADITFYAGPSHAVVLELIASEWSKFAEKSHTVGFSIEESAVLAVLHQSGVWKVEVTSPTLPLVVTDAQAAYCTAVTLNDIGNHNG